MEATKKLTAAALLKGLKATRGDKKGRVMLQRADVAAVVGEGADILKGTIPNVVRVVADEVIEAMEQRPKGPVSPVAAEMLEHAEAVSGDVIDVIEVQRSDLIEAFGEDSDIVVATIPKHVVFNRRAAITAIKDATKPEAKPETKPAAKPATAKE